MRHRHIDRRTFLRGAVAGGAIATAGGLGLRALLREPPPWDEAAFPPPGDARVAVLSGHRLRGTVESTVLEGLRAIDADVVGANVLVKPNLVEFDPTTVDQHRTHDDRRPVLALRRLGAASVRRRRRPGHRRDVQDVVTRVGTRGALAGVEAPFVDLNHDELRRVPLRSRYRARRPVLPRRCQADVVVSLPKMKTHHWAGVTLSLKNLFGTLPGHLLRLAEERAALARHRTASSTSPTQAARPGDRGRHRRHGGRRPARRRRRSDRRARVR